MPLPQEGIKTKNESVYKMKDTSDVINKYTTAILWEKEGQRELRLNEKLRCSRDFKLSTSCDPHLHMNGYCLYFRKGKLRCRGRKKITRIPTAKKEERRRTEPIGFPGRALRPLPWAVTLLSVAGLDLPGCTAGRHRLLVQGVPTGITGGFSMMSAPSICCRGRAWRRNRVPQQQ